MLKTLVLFQHYLVCPTLAAIACTIHALTGSPHGRTGQKAQHVGYRCILLLVSQPEPVLSTPGLASVG